MPEDKPGLSSISNAKKAETDVTKVGSRKRDDNVETKKVTTVKTETKPTESEPTITKTPTAKEVKTTTTEPLKKTKSSFIINDVNYNVIDDNTAARRLIKWDDEGNVAADSPVTIIGRNIDGGFILAATDQVKGVNPSLFPYSETTGISFPSLDADVAGESPRMQGMHRGTYENLSDVYDPQAARKLRGIYKRTGQL